MIFSRRKKELNCSFFSLRLIKQMEDKKLVAVLNMLTYDDPFKAAKATGIPIEELIDWTKDDSFLREIHRRENAILRLATRAPSLCEPLNEWLANTKIEALPLFYNFELEDSDWAIEQFVKEHNIYCWHSPLDGKEWIEVFRNNLKHLKALVDKYLAGESLSAEEIQELEFAKSEPPCIFYGHEDGTIKRYRRARNIGSLNITRALADFALVIKGKKIIKRCAAPDCDKIFVPRKEGGRKQIYHSRECANKQHQKNFRDKSKNR